MYNVHQGTRVADLQSQQPGCDSFLCEPMGTVEDYDDVHRIDSAIDWLDSRKNGDKPFALYLPLDMPHPPYTVPQSFYEMYNPEDVPSPYPYDQAGQPEFRKWLRQYHHLDQVGEEFFRRINAVYLGMISYTDWLLGRLLDAMDRLNLTDNTVLVLLSDHGDYAGDYGMVQKNWACMEDVHTRVPFIWRGPGIAKDHVVQEPVELFDLMTTTLDLSGIQITYPHCAQSLVPQLQGQAGDLDRAAFAQGGIGSSLSYCLDHQYMDGLLLEDTQNFYHPQALCSRDHPEIAACATMIRTSTHKLIRRPSLDSELYDLKNDPHELRNLYSDPQHATIRMQLEERLINWLIQTGNVTPRRVHPRGAPPMVWQ